jgi:hypothetical protein
VVLTGSGPVQALRGRFFSGFLRRSLKEYSPKVLMMPTDLDRLV